MEWTTIIFAVLIYLTTIITAIGFLLGYKPNNNLSMPTLTCCRKEKSRKMSTNDPARGTPDGREDVTELKGTGVTEPPHDPTEKNDRGPKLKNQCLAGKPLELEKAQNMDPSLDRNQETNS